MSESRVKELKILGDFGYPWLLPAVWNKCEKKWVAAVVQSSFCDGIEDSYFESEYFDDEELKSWLEIPTET